MSPPHRYTLPEEPLAVSKGRKIVAPLGFILATLAAVIWGTQKYDSVFNRFDSIDVKLNAIEIQVNRLWQAKESSNTAKAQAWLNPPQSSVTQRM